MHHLPSSVLADIETRLLAQRGEIALLRMRFIIAHGYDPLDGDAPEHKFNPNWPSQPRVPAGNPDGGQWTSGAGGGGGAKPRGRGKRDTQARNRRDAVDTGRLITSLLRPSPFTLPLTLSGDTPQPVYTAREVPGTADLRLVLVRRTRSGVDEGYFERLVRPAREVPFVVFGLDTGIGAIEPAEYERLDVEVVVDGDNALFDRRALAEAYGREIPGVTNSDGAPRRNVTIPAQSPEERLLVENMRRFGASQQDINTAIQNLRAEEDNLVAALQVSGASRERIEAARLRLRRARMIFPASDARSRVPITRPSGRHEAGNLFGAPEQPHENADDSERTSKRLQNEAAQRLGDAGYLVYQQPYFGRRGAPSAELRSAGLRDTARPDLIIEHRIFDVTRPVNNNVGSLADGISEKVTTRQTFRIVVTLQGSTVTRAELQRQLRMHPIPGLIEVITIDQSGRIGHAYP